MSLFNIQPMGMEHIDGVLNVEENTFSITWTRADFVREITENSMAVYFVALNEENQVVGYAGMWHVVNEGQITNVAVLHEFRGNGIGNMLMDSLVGVAVEREFIGINLEVRVGNVSAQKMYHKYGFKVDGIRKGYYEDNREDAVVMWKDML